MGCISKLLCYACIYFIAHIQVELDAGGRKLGKAAQEKQFQVLLKPKICSKTPNHNCIRSLMSGLKSMVGSIPEMLKYLVEEFGSAGVQENGVPGGLGSPILAKLVQAVVMILDTFSSISERFLRPQRY